MRSDVATNGLIPGVLAAAALALASLAPAQQPNQPGAALRFYGIEGAPWPVPVPLNLAWQGPAPSLRFSVSGAAGAPYALLVQPAGILAAGLPLQPAGILDLGLAGLLAPIDGLGLGLGGAAFLGGFAQVSASGTSTWTLPLVASAAGFHGGFQAVVLDAANPVGVSLSGAADLTVFSDPSAAFFVAAWGSAANPGSAQSPLASVAAAINASFAAPAPHPAVFVMAGSYAESGLMFRDGVDVTGGCDPVSWVPNPAGLSVIQLPSAGAQAVAITAPTTVRRIELRSADAPGFQVPAASSIALSVSQCTAALTLDRCVFASGSGGDGAAGSNGTDGPSGENGIGGQSVVFAPAPGGGGAGGGGPWYGGAGGGGAYGGGLWGWPGNDGFFGGSGGSGGPPGGCLNQANISGQPGGNGAAGAQGQPGGPQASLGGSAAGGVWAPDADGGSGTSGDWGRGGGGGGGGGGTQEAGSACIVSYGGGGGGGGGSGGGPGGPGTGGRGGGASLALFLFDSSPVIHACAFRAAAGGRGGEGGNGGLGGPAGNGGWGGGGVIFPIPVFGGYYGTGGGGAGGYGGAGGHGGCGAGGNGGPSWCVYRAGTSAPALIAPSFLSGTGGQGGASGNSGPLPGPASSNGSPGPSGIVF